MEENEKNSPLVNRQFFVEQVGASFIIREALPTGHVVHAIGDYSAVCDFFSSL